MARIFVYDNREFPDPDPKMSTEDVRQSMATFFPELSNADTSGPTKRPNKADATAEDQLYEFKRRTGTKGTAYAVKYRLITTGIEHPAAHRKGLFGDLVQWIDTGIYSLKVGGVMFSVPQQWACELENKVEKQ